MLLRTEPRHEPTKAGRGRKGKKGRQAAREAAKEAARAAQKEEEQPPPAPEPPPVVVADAPPDVPDLLLTTPQRRPTGPLPKPPTRPIDTGTVTVIKKDEPKSGIMRFLWLIALVVVLGGAATFWYMGKSDPVEEPVIAAGDDQLCPAPALSCCAPAPAPAPAEARCSPPAPAPVLSLPLPEPVPAGLLLPEPERPCWRQPAPTASPPKAPFRQPSLPRSWR